MLVLGTGDLEFYEFLRTIFKKYIHYYLFYSGGGLICNGQIAGIVSFGHGCGRSESIFVMKNEK
jgi:hypothetical protein